MILKYCQLCNHKLLKVFSLGKQPLCDDLKKIGTKKKSELYKTDIYFCKRCIIAYNKFQINPKKLFPKSYHYRANLTGDVLNGMQELVNDVKKSYGTLKNKKVLDIGCNDGSLLDFFKKNGATTIGVEPTNACKNIKKHTIFNNFFSKEISKKINKKFGNIDFIIFTNVFAHINNLNQLISNLKLIINRKTKIVIENHYLGSVIQSNQFDTFYHEHPRTYSLRSLKIISELLEMKLSYFSFPKRYGGNIRVIFSNDTIKFTKKNYLYIEKKEKKFFLKLKNMKSKILRWKRKTLKTIKLMKKKDMILVGKGFPGRASILINLLKLNNKDIECIFEKTNSPKIGHYAPNTNIPIVSDAKLKHINKNNVIINFAWHINKEIKKYLFKKKIYNMKTIILCGGLGTRLGTETKKIPKPMVRIAGRPIVEYIIRGYMKYGFNDFILATGYKNKEIKTYFSKLKINAKINCVNTGLKLHTGGRILKLKKYLDENKDFMLTYGDGLSAQNFSKLNLFHKKNKKISTITIVRPPARFGQVNINKKSIVTNFKEKSKVNLGWINGGFFVLNFKIFKFFKSKNEMFEHGPLERLAKKKQLAAFKFEGTWQCMDTPRDKKILTKLIKKNKFRL